MRFTVVKNDGGLMKEGDYECILVRCEETTTKTGGLPVIAFDFQVRQDVEQPYRRKHIFKNFYQDSVTGKWPMDNIGKLANSLGLKIGDDFDLEDLVGRCCILHVKPFTGQDGVERDTVYWSAPTKAGQMIQEAESFTQVEEEEIPF